MSVQSVFFYSVAVLAVTCYAFLSIISKKMQFSVPPFTFIALTMTIMTALAWATSFIYERSFTIRDLSLSEIGLLGAFAVINLVGFALYLKALTGMPVGLYQIFGILTPVIGSFFAFLLLGERLGLRFFLALPVFLIGLFIAFGGQ